MPAERTARPGTGLRHLLRAVVGVLAFQLLFDGVRAARAARGRRTRS